MRSIVATIIVQLTFLTCFGFLQTNASKAKIDVGANVQVSVANQNLKHDEVYGCADPSNPNRIMVGSIIDNMDRFNPWTILYVSFDGGNSWEVGVQNHAVAPAVSQDPACSYGPDGTAYFVSDDGPTDYGEDGEGGGDSALFRSPDGGKNWLSPTKILHAYDRPYVAVDGTGGRYNGRIYVSHTGIGGIVLQRSVDGGQTFLGPILRPGLIVHEPQPTTLPGNTVVLTDGTVISLFYQVSPDKNGFERDSLRVTRSVDGGGHYERDVKVADYSFSYARDGVGWTLPNLAADLRSPFFKDRLYVVWDSSEEHSLESYISVSSDGGKTWSSPKRFDTPSSATNAKEYQPTVAVNKDGVVGVMWYEGFERADIQGYWVNFSASLDGGETWAPAVRVSEAPCVFGGTEKIQVNGSASNDGGRLRLQLWPLVWRSSGHTAGLAADAKGVFHAFWVDNRTGISQVWTAPVSVSGHVYKYGAEEFADLDDLSNLVGIDLVRTMFDKGTHNVSVTIQLKNVSDHTIAGPLKLRITTLRSDFGIPVIYNAENGMSSEGAILDLSDLVRRGNLKPKEESAETTLKFQISSVEKFRLKDKWQITDGRWRLVTLEGRIFGKALP